MTNKLDIFTFLEGVKSNYSFVKRYTIDNGGYGKPSIGLYLKKYTPNGEFNEYSEKNFNIKLHKKVEKVVEEGDHQGWNDNGEPVVCDIVLKSNIELALEIKSIIKSWEENKEAIVEAERIKDLLHNQQIENEIEFDKKLEEFKKQNLSSIDPETLTSDFKMIEQGEEE